MGKPRKSSSNKNKGHANYVQPAGDRDKKIATKSKPRAAVASKELRDYYSSSTDTDDDSSNTSSTIASTDESDDQNGGKYESSSDESSVGSGFLKDGLPNIVINGDAEGGAVNIGDEKQKKKKKKKRKKEKEKSVSKSKSKRKQKKKKKKKKKKKEDIYV